MILHCPDLFAGGTKVARMVANVDVAPTILEAAGLPAPPGIDGRSVLSLARGEPVAWRDTLLYEYFWERNLPQVPTLHALRGERYKYIRCSGLWDTDELYDLRDDPHEARNLIDDPAHREVAGRMNRALFEALEASGGMSIPLSPDRGGQQNQRRRGAPPAAEFPESFFRD
jgi:N-acetylglucosamine-6-sulfatase